MRWLQKPFLAWSRLRKGFTLGVRIAVLDANGGVFLVKHGYLPGWYLPGGGVEPGETMAEAVARELLEEGGIRLDGPAELFGLYYNRALSKRDHVALFVSRAWTQLHQPKPNWEIVETGFFPVDALPSDATEATRRRLGEILKGHPRPEEW